MAVDTFLVDTLYSAYMPHLVATTTKQG